MPRRSHAAKKSRSHRRSILSGRWGVLGGFLFLALLVVIVIAFKPQPAAPAEISVEEAHQKYEEGVFFLDVREQEEWDAFHIPGTTLIPLGELESRLDELPRDRDIVVVCRSGNRSQVGRDTLLEAGFTSVTSMSGGVTAWSNFGYPIEGTRP